MDLGTIIGVFKGDNGLLPQILAIAGGGAVAPSLILLGFSILHMPGVYKAYLATAKIGGFVSNKLNAIFGSAGEKIEDKAQIAILDWVIEFFKYMDEDDSKKRIVISYTVSNGDSKKKESSEESLPE
jgi:hypothetical protein